MKIVFSRFCCLAFLVIAACSPKPSAKEVELQQRIDSLEARIHTLELDRSLTEGSSYSRFPNIKAEAQAEGKLAAQKAQWEALESLPASDRSNALVALNLANDRLKTLRMELTDLESEYDSFRSSLGPTHPKMMSIQARREQTQEAINRETEDVMFGLKTQLEISTRWVAAMKNPSRNSPQP